MTFSGPVSNAVDRRVSALPDSRLISSRVASSAPDMFRQLSQWRDEVKGMSIT